MVSPTDGCSTFGSGWLLKVGAVFFAAIVFAGFLAALRAAGFLPAAFFFAGAGRAFADRFDFTAIFAALLPDDVFAAVRRRAVDFLAVLFFVACLRADFAALRAGRRTDFFADDFFDFAAIAHLRHYVACLG